MADPSTGKATELPVRGLVVAGLSDGTVVIIGNPKGLEANLPASDFVKQGRLMLVSADGKVLADIAPANIISTTPEVSPNGKFVAFKSKPADAPNGSETEFGFTILSVDGKTKRELNTSYFPLTVMDDGAALVIATDQDENGMGLMTWISKNGKTTKVVKAVSATVIGKSIIYATNNKPAIKTMPVPAE